MPVKTTTPSKSQTVELGRYFTARGEERLLVGRRGDDGVVRIFDVPNAGDRLRGRSYFVEAGFESKAELAVFRRRYLEDAERIGDSPMSRRAIERIVAKTDGRARKAIS
ncbi:MAG: hypothetical protein GEU88_19595 [Solirubrobacterales bacterium]|nr:hypothetical protein [Solirubrobacterales bacterium]